MILLTLIACFHTTTDAPPFVCEGAPAPTPASPGPRPPMGWVSVEALSPAVDWNGWRFQSSSPSVSVASVWGTTERAQLEAVLSSQGWFDQQAARTRVAISADAAPLHQIALALGKTLTLDVKVSEDAGRKVVTAFYHDTSLAEILQMLRVDHGVTVRFVDGVLNVGTVSPACGWCSQPITTTFFSTEEIDARPQTLAAVYCQDLASPVGSAAVVGDQVYIRDTPTATDAFRALHASLVPEAQP